MWSISRVIVGVYVDTSVAESTHPLHTHQSIDVEEEEVVECHIEQLLPPGEEKSLASASGRVFTTHIDNNNNNNNNNMYNQEKCVYTCSSQVLRGKRH